MKKYAAPITLGLACVAYGLIAVFAFYFAAQAQGATAAYTDCLMQRFDAFNQNNEELKHTFGDLTLQVNKSIKSGQTVALHTQAVLNHRCRANQKQE